MKFVLGLGLLAACVAVLAQLCSAGAIDQKSYLIKGRKVEHVVDAVTQMRQFLHIRFNEGQRCQRLALLLNAYKRNANHLGYFKLVEIAVLPQTEADNRFNLINIDILRDLYMDAILKFVEADRVGSALVELNKCLSDGFRNRDVKARAFLNDDNLKQIIEQYEAIAKQPALLLVNDHEKHPKLTLGSLNPSVRRSLARLFEGDEYEVAKLFSDSSRYQNVPKVPQAQAQAHVQTATGRGGAQANASAGDQAAMAAVLVLPPSPSARPERAQAVPDQSPKQNAPKPAARQSRAPLQQPQQAEAPEEDSAAIDAAYLGDILGTIVNVYESLPIETPLNERCRTYSNVIEAEKEDLYRDSFIEEQLRGAAERLAKAPSNEPFVPEQLERENLLFIVQTFDPLQGGEEAWTDLVDCASQWQNVDEEARAFLNSPQLADTYQQLLALSQEADGQPQEQV